MEAFFVNIFLHPSRNPCQCKNKGRLSAFLARGYVIYTPRVTHEENKSHNPLLQADNSY